MKNNWCTFYQWKKWSLEQDYLCCKFIIDHFHYIFIIDTGYINFDIFLFFFFKLIFWFWKVNALSDFIDLDCSVLFAITQFNVNIDWFVHTFAYYPGLYWNVQFVALEWCDIDKKKKKKKKKKKSLQCTFKLSHSMPVVILSFRPCGMRP